MAAAQGRSRLRALRAPDHRVAWAGWCLGLVKPSPAGGGGGKDRRFAGESWQALPFNLDARACQHGRTLLHESVRVVAGVSEPGELSLFICPAQLAMLEALMHRGGLLDPSKMGGAFTLPGAHDLLWQPAVRNYLKGRRDELIDLMAWNADGRRRAGDPDPAADDWMATTEQVAGSWWPAVRRRGG